MSQLTFTIFSQVLLWLVVKAIYNIFAHPLRRYPGPWYRAASRIPYTVTICRGDTTQRVKALHEKYGHVVRIAPDTLSYTSGEAWAGDYSSLLCYS